MLSEELSNAGPWTDPGGPSHMRTVKSAERALALFELFSLHQRPMAVGEIARRMNIPQPSASMLVRNLASLGYLEHDRAERTFLPTLRIMLLGSWISGRFPKGFSLEHRLEDLFIQTGETVLLGIQNGSHSQYVMCRLPDHPSRMEVQSGLLRPITATAIGRVLLSLKQDEEILAVVRRCNSEVAEDRLKVRPADFMTLIQTIRSQGFARTDGDMMPENSVIAVVVPIPLGRTPTAVGVGGATKDIRAKEAAILKALRQFQDGRPAEGQS